MFLTSLFLFQDEVDWNRLVSNPKFIKFESVRDICHIVGRNERYIFAISNNDGQ